MKRVRCSDQEFISLWNELGSPSKVATELGVNLRSVYERRRRLETAYNIVLSAEPRPEIKEMKFLDHVLDDGIVVTASDLHCWPGEFTTAQKAFLATIKHMQPDVCVLNGDVFDGAKVSRFGSSEWNKLPSVAQELKACINYLAAIKKAAPKKTRLIWVMGNHDQRFARKLIEAAGEFESVAGFDLRDHFPGWEFCYRFTVNPNSDGMTDFVHNWAGGIHAAYNNVLRSGCNYVTGHTHRLLDRPWSDRSGRRYGIETGTLTDVDGPQSYYVAGRPVDWGSGFPVLTYREGKLMRPEYVDVIGKNKISFRAQIVHL